ncbi:MAG: type IV pilus assembly protein PilC [Acidimicrobiales bacterium]|jgi:type IV pilus assembly protein PilC
MPKEKKQNFLVRIIRALDSVHFGIGKERDYFVENLSMLVTSGMPIVSSVTVLEQGVGSGGMKKILGIFREDLEGGMLLWKAFDKTGIFSGHTIALIKIGEESGRLVENLKLISEQEKKDRSFRGKLRSAMMYPVFVLTLTVFIGVAIAWFILPRLATVFDQLQVDLPFLTKTLISGGQFLAEHGVMVFSIFFFILGNILYFTFFFEKTKFVGQYFLFSIPGIKRLIQEVEIARFGYILGTLLEAGLPITRALDSLHSAAQFPHYKKFYAHLEDSINEGNSFQKSFKSYERILKIIPGPIQQLIVAGENSGSLSNTLFSISATYEEKTENTTKNLAVILEPVLLVIVWLGVVSVALAVIMPIYNLVGGLSVGASPDMSVGVVVSEESPPEQLIIATSTPEEVPIQLVSTETATSADETIIPEFTPTSTNETQIPTFAASSTSATSTSTTGTRLNDALSPVGINPKLKINSTGIGYLNVRTIPSTTGSIVKKVFPGEVYEYSNIDTGWYEIIIDDKNTGWIAGKYVTIVKNAEG